MKTAACILGLVMIGSCVIGGHDISQIQYRYMVRSGDTVWTIAESFADGEDVRHVAYEIMKENSIDMKTAVIRPGQELVVTVRAEK